MIFNKLDNTAKGKIRPRFKLQTPETKETFIRLVQAEAEKNPAVKLSVNRHKYLRLSIPEEEQHYWSPVLNISCDDEEEPHKTIIRGHIGPSENVWSLFVLVYSAIAIVGFFGSIWAYVKWNVDGETGYLIIIPIAILLVLSIFLTSKFGQYKGHSQMLRLLRFLRRAVDTIECERTL
ncbi:MAG: hypothetical protein CSA38_02815 [Flavobacteriales bacterium]|nr:MAG: hypothetical protein CSA38_02815 [Flavobacteriales bacterium]